MQKYHQRFSAFFLTLTLVFSTLSISAKNPEQLINSHKEIVTKSKEEIVIAGPAEKNREAEEPQELIIIGGGIAGALHAHRAYKDSRDKGLEVHITMYEKNKYLDETTTANIAPSLTPDEILSVIPRGKALVEKLAIPFNEPGGIRIDDVENVATLPAAMHFMEQAEFYSHDQAGYEKRTKTLLDFGRSSMQQWQQMYDEADEELKEILTSSNFNPCREPRSQQGKMLHDGYRVDLIYNVSDAPQRAASMKADYESIGYKNCAVLSPAEVIEIDPFLADFCKGHATVNKHGELEWNADSIALWRPGGCIDAKVFLPKFYEYLKKKMGTYKTGWFKKNDCFRIVYGKEVDSLETVAQNKDTVRITGLHFKNESSAKLSDACTCVFCPGEAVGTLKKLGFKEPAYAGFAGASLMLNIPVPQDKIVSYSAFSHCMEVHQEGIVLAWQARIRDGKIFIGVAGTKSFYGDQRPTKDQAFAKNRNLLQFNMINDVLPEFISLALGRDTKGKTLTQADLDTLENSGIAKRWAGVRAVAFDGFPTLGSAYTVEGFKVENAIVTTHLGSGGASFGPAAVDASCRSQGQADENNELTAAVLDFAQSCRTAQSCSN